MKEKKRNAISEKKNRCFFRLVFFFLYCCVKRKMMKKTFEKVKLREKKIVTSFSILILFFCQIRKCNVNSVHKIFKYKKNIPMKNDIYILFLLLFSNIKCKISILTNGCPPRCKSDKDKENRN